MILASLATVMVALSPSEIIKDPPDQVRAQLGISYLCPDGTLDLRPGPNAPTLRLGPKDQSKPDVFAEALISSVERDTQKQTVVITLSGKAGSELATLSITGPFPPNYAQQPIMVLRVADRPDRTFQCYTFWLERS